MSGGSYDYKFSSLEDLAQDLENYSENRSTQEIDKPYFKQINQYQPTRNRLAKALRKLAVQCRDAEWIDSGDTGEEGWKKIDKFLTKHNF